MGFLLASTTHAPLTAVVMVFEMTLDYGMVVPLLLGSAVATLVARRLSGNSVYTEALQRKAGGRRSRRARSTCCASPTWCAADQVTVAPELALPQLLDVFVASRRNHLYVVDERGGFVGAVNLHDVNEALRAAGGAGALVARDAMRARFEVTTPEEGLPRVLERFAAQECERLPVLRDLETRRLVGTISKRDILSVYSLELLQRSARRTGAAPDRAGDRDAGRRAAAAGRARGPQLRRVALPRQPRARAAAGAARRRRACCCRMPSCASRPATGSWCSARATASRRCASGRASLSPGASPAR